MKFDQDLWNCDMTSRSYFGKMNSTLRSVVPLAMFFKPGCSLLPLLGTWQGWHNSSLHGEQVETNQTVLMLEIFCQKASCWILTNQRLSRWISLWEILLKMIFNTRPEFVATWLGIAKIGAVPALVNYNLRLEFHHLSGWTKVQNELSGLTRWCTALQW